MKSFKGHKAWLSNMNIFPKPVLHNDELIGSSEVYYMSRKVISPNVRKLILSMNPYEAKKYCSSYRKNITLRSDWDDDYRLKVMKEALDVKFSIPYYRIRLLLFTGELIEHNDHGDTFFGICNGVGEDHLGRLLREKRIEILREEKYRESIVIGNLYESDIDYKCFTANATLNSKGALVMGAGNAKVVRDKYPGIDIRFGEILVSRRTPYDIDVLYGLLLDAKEKIIAFQTKTHFSKDSYLGIVINSIDKLNVMARNNPDHAFGLPFPGINNGKLRENIILPYLVKLEKNITIWKENYNTPITIVLDDLIPDDISKLMRAYIEILRKRKYDVRVIGEEPYSKYDKYVDIDTKKYFPTYELKSHDEKLKVYDIVSKILGNNLTTPSEVVIMWTPDAIEARYAITPLTGYINGAIMKLAYDNDIPIINLGIAGNRGSLND